MRNRRKNNWSKRKRKKIWIQPCWLYGNFYKSTKTKIIKTKRKD